MLQAKLGAEAGRLFSPSHSQSLYSPSSSVTERKSQLLIDDRRSFPPFSEHVQESLAKDRSLLAESTAVLAVLLIASLDRYLEGDGWIT